MNPTILDGAEQKRNLLRLLDAVEQDGATSQRRIAAELDIALGLVNAYLKRCMKKGLVKVRQAPARRYVYYLTPRGFAEKSRLTVEYLSYSFSFFRHAKQDCHALFAEARVRGFGRLALAGRSELAELAAICAFESGVELIAVVDAKAGGATYAGLPLVRDFADLPHEPDAVMITDLVTAQATWEQVIARYGVERTLVPVLLQLRSRGRQENGA